MKRLLVLAFCVFQITAFSQSAPREGFQWEGIELLAIQDRGRLKPLDTFAEEAVLFVTGRRSWQKRPPIETIFSWLTSYEKEWDETAFIKIENGPLKTKLGLSTSEKYFTPKELRENSALRDLLREAMQKENRKERLTELEKKAVQVQQQKILIDSVVTGASLNLFPNKDDINDPWYPLSQITESGGLPYPSAQMEKLASTLKSLVNAFLENNATNWNASVAPFVEAVHEVGQGKYPPLSSLKREVHYNNLRPFRDAWIFYALAFVLLLATIVGKNKALQIAAIAAVLAAWGLHTYGFVLRCLIAGRPPVTNMYESVIWVTWGCMLFALLIWMKYKNAVIPAAASVFAIVGLVLADNLPTALDASINPLEPVLRSNFWLTIHVLTITLSYAAFALSLCLGNVVLGKYLWTPKATSSIQMYSLYMYRAMQIGVVLLAAGTILGGVWADYSWGRFWGWDPKEVWALIALLLYLAVLHGRFSGWLKGFGFVATTVMSFLGVLMAWYGVNFVLGVGLHSYGFGTGGAEWVLGYVAVQVAFILVAYFRFRSNTKGDKETAILPKLH